MTIKFDKPLISLAIIICACISIIACSHTNTVVPEKEYITVPVVDTITINHYKNHIVELEKELKQTRDSLHNVRDSFSTELFVANYKLGRIEYYNKIAAKGNNIKYLRGWINRVLQK